jgi:hypothetical protein
MCEMDEPTGRVKGTTNDDLRFEDLCNDPNWQGAMTLDYKTLMANQTWTLVPLPPSHNVIRACWVFCTKPPLDGCGIRYKACLVARGFQQRAGIDYHKTFAPVVKFKTIHLIAGVTAHLGWPIKHLDV